MSGRVHTPLLVGHHLTSFEPHDICSHALAQLSQFKPQQTEVKALCRWPLVWRRQNVDPQQTEVKALPLSFLKRLCAIPAARSASAPGFRRQSATGQTTCLRESPSLGVEAHFPRPLPPGCCPGAKRCSSHGQHREQPVQLCAGLAGKTPAGALRADPEQKWKEPYWLDRCLPRPVPRDTGQEGTAGQSAVVENPADFPNRGSRLECGERRAIPPEKLKSGSVDNGFSHFFSGLEGKITCFQKFAGLAGGHL